jgi:hypothetical protein
MTQKSASVGMRSGGSNTASNDNRQKSNAKGEFHHQ